MLGVQMQEKTGGKNAQVYYMAERQNGSCACISKAVLVLIHENRRLLSDGVGDTLEISFGLDPGR